MHACVCVCVWERSPFKPPIVDSGYQNSKASFKEGQDHQIRYRLLIHGLNGSTGIRYHCEHLSISIKFRTLQHVRTCWTHYSFLCAVFRVCIASSGATYVKLSIVLSADTQSNGGGDTNVNLSLPALVAELKQDFEADLHELLRFQAVHAAQIQDARVRNQEQRQSRKELAGQAQDIQDLQAKLGVRRHAVN